MRNAFFMTGVTLLILTLSSCNLPKAAEPTPTADIVATQVSVLLTEQPTPTPQPTLPPQATSVPILVTPTATQPSSTETPAAPSATPSAQDPAVYLGDPTGTDPLDSGKSFGLESTAYDDDYTSIRVENGALVLTSRYATGYRGWRTGGTKIQNAYTEATVQVGECSGSDMYGLITRSVDFVKGYWFQVTCEGKWAFGYWDGEKYVELKTSPNVDSAVHSGSNQTNRLGVMAQGETFALFINGLQVGEVTDSALKDAGAYGMLISSRNTPNFTIYTQEFKYWTLP